MQFLAYAGSWQDTILSAYFRTSEKLGEHFLSASSLKSPWIRKALHSITKQCCTKIEMESYFGSNTWDNKYNEKVNSKWGSRCSVCERKLWTAEIVLRRLDAFSRRRTSNVLFASFMYSSYATKYCSHVCFLLRFWGIKSWQQLWLAWESCWESIYCVFYICVWLTSGQSILA